MPRIDDSSPSFRTSGPTIRSPGPAPRGSRSQGADAARRLAALLAGLAFIGFSLWLKAELRVSPEAPGLPPGAEAPRLELPSIEGGTVDLAEVLPRHRLVAVVFWATWCAPCRVELRRLAELDTVLGDDFGVVAVSVDAGEVEVVRSYLAEHPVPFPVVVDDRREAVEAFAVSSLPTTFLVGADGEVQQVHRGFVGSLPTQVRYLVGASGG